MEGPTKHEQELEEKEEEEEQEEDREVEGEGWNEKTQQRQEEGECTDYTECTSLGFRESDGEKSLDLPESPRPLSQETRNLTASELLLNKSVELIKKTRLKHFYELMYNSFFPFDVFSFSPFSVSTACLKMTRSQSLISFSRCCRGH